MQNVLLRVCFSQQLRLRTGTSLLCYIRALTLGDARSKGTPDWRLLLNILDMVVAAD